MVMNNVLKIKLKLGKNTKTNELATEKRMGRDKTDKKLVHFNPNLNEKEEKTADSVKTRNVARYRLSRGRNPIKKTNTANNTEESTKIFFFGDTRWANG